VTKSVCLFLEQHCYLKDKHLKKVGGASLWLLPTYWDAVADDTKGYDYFTENPGIVKLVGPIEAEQAVRCQQALQSCFHELGFKVQMETLCDD